jgi:predicted PurR-regulated permease PerM
MAKQEQIYSFFLLGILAVSLYFAYQVLNPFLNNIFIAVILASLLHPVHQRLKTTFGGRDTLAALCSTLLVLVLVILPMFLFTGALVGQAAKSIAGLQSWIKGAHLDTWLSRDSISPYVAWVQGHFPWLELDITQLDLKNSLLDLSKNMGQVMIDLGTRMVGNFIGVLLDFMIMLFVLFFLFRDGEAMLRQLKHLSPLHDEQEDRILGRLRDVARSVVVGSFLVAVCQGVAGGVGLAIVGIPALFWGAMMGFAALVPVVGTMLIWGPAALYLLIVGDWKGALILTGWGAVIVSGIDSVLRPMLMKGQAQMSTFWVFLSIIGGIKFFGPLGILYGPMILALAMVMLGIYADEYRDLLDSKSCPGTGTTGGDG